MVFFDIEKKKILVHENSFFGPLIGPTVAELERTRVRRIQKELPW